MSDRNFYRQLRSILERESVAVATIVRAIGSAPREVGAKMAICADRSIIGTIGGGIVYSLAADTGQLPLQARAPPEVR